MKKLLERRDIDPSKKDGGGLSPLHWAAQNNQTDAINVLAEDPRVAVNQRDDSGVFSAFSGLHFTGLLKIITKGQSLRC
jgi:ankyrin repeat protein